MNTNDNVTLASTVTVHSGLSRQEAEGLFYGAIGVLAFSGSMVATRASAPELGGMAVGLGRSALAGLLAVAFLLTRGGAGARLPPRETWLGLSLVMLGGVIGFPVLSALAMERGSASRGLLFTSVLPLATAIIAAMRLGERPGRRFWACALGSAALVYGYARSEAQGSQGGDGLLLGAMVLAAVSYAEGGRVARVLGGLNTWCWALVFGLPLVLPAFLIVAARAPMHGGPGAWAGFAYVTLISSFFGFFAWYRGLAMGGVARTSQLQAVQPLLGLAWSALLLGEALPLPLVATAAGVVVLVALGRR